MPALILAPRYTDDSMKLWRACVTLGWEVERAHKWEIPEVKSAEIALYGEPIFVGLAAQKFGLTLLEPAQDWLARLPEKWRRRDVRFRTLGEARSVSGPVFIKPADEKCFDAKVYGSGAELPGVGLLPEDLPVLIQEPVQWEVEYRCFVMDRRVVTASAYWRHGAIAWESTEGSGSTMKRNTGRRWSFVRTFSTSRESKCRMRWLLMSEPSPGVAGR